jgi:uncharacterized protein (TIGR02246 family)
MKKTLLAILLAAAAASAALAADHTADEAAIRKGGDEFAAAWNKNDYKALAAKFTADADLINPMGRQAKGSAEVEQLFKDEQSSIMKGSTFTRTIRATQWVAPEAAVQTWDAVVTGMHDPMGNAVPPLKHIVTVVFVKQGESWLVANARPMVPQPPPNPPNSVVRPVSAK